MAEGDRTNESLLGTTWIGSAEHHDVNKLTIDFDKPQTCTTRLGDKQGPGCNWSQYWGGGTHHFGLIGGSIHLMGTCSVADGTAEATGMVAGTGPEGWTFTKQE